MSAHTPGPWSRAWIHGALRHINRNVDTEDFYEGSIPKGEETPNVRINPADADLIAAAPDLLAALKAVVATMATDHVAYFETQRAIAKAEGKS